MPSRKVPAATARQLQEAQAQLFLAPAWSRDAACARLPISPAAFDPDYTDATRNGYKHGYHTPAEQDRRDELAEAARNICTSYCPVQVECMAAGSVGLEWGVWGGVKRETIPLGPTASKRRRQRAAHQPAAWQPAHQPVSHPVRTGDANARV
jgi:hypothetical protein